MAIAICKLEKKGSSSQTLNDGEICAEIPRSNINFFKPLCISKNIAGTPSPEIRKFSCM